jgi:hypothetical protein
MNDCSNKPCLPTNVTSAIKHFTSVQEVNDCDSGYNDGRNQYCHIGLAKQSTSDTIILITWADIPRLGSYEISSSRGPTFALVRIGDKRINIINPTTMK